MKMELDGRLEWKNGENSAKLYIGNVQLIPLLSILVGRQVKMVIEVKG